MSQRSAESLNRRFVFAGSLIRRIAPWLAPALFLGVFFFYPLARILWLGFNPASLSGLGANDASRTFYVLLFTFYQAFLSTLLTLLVGLPAAYLFARFDFYGKPLLRLLTAIPFMLPTVVVAAGFNALLGPRGWVNLGLMRLFGLEAAPIVFVYTLSAILLAHVFYNTTIVIRVVGNALAHLDPRLEQAARLLGADARRAFWRVTLPLLRPSILAAALLVFLFDFTSFGVILLLGGPRFATLEVEIYMQAIQIFNLPLAAVLSFIQLLCTLAFSVLYSRIVTRAAVTVAPHAAESNLRRARTWREKLFVGGVALLLLTLFLLPMASLPLRSVARLESARGERTAVNYGLTSDYYAELFVN
ncbi:MAG: ABC transporter permease subunit, partial [Anaerolineales bacterium]|nr:ABC transporter permease subunit [Anaerolineales bacterium]